jgi:hypothetical protein
MTRATFWLALALGLACRENRSGVPEAGTPNAGLRAGNAGSQDTEPGVEFEAPRLIPAIHAQITRLQEPQGSTEENLTAFRDNVGALVSAMQTDLHRVGVADSGDFRHLSDSLIRAFGGGPGPSAKVKPEEARPLSHQVERLIGLYEERMRAAPK